MDAAFSTPTLLGRLVAAAVLAGLIGWERESHQRPAGLRTHILVSVGSALITLVSQEFFFLYAREGVPADPGRIAAQIVSGIGFLGAGTILREGASIRGLTTAASLWVAAAIGLAVGAGSFAAALITTAVTLVALVYLGRVERRVVRGKRVRRLGLRVLDRPGALAAVTAVLAQHQVDIRAVELEPADGEDEVRIELAVRIPPGVPVERLLEQLRAVEGVGTTELRD